MYIYIWWMYIYEYDVRLLFIGIHVSDLLTFIKKDTHVWLHIRYLSYQHDSFHPWLYTNTLNIHNMYIIFITYIHLIVLIYGCFPKICGFSLQIIHFNRVFHYFHHPFWGTTIFGNTHTYMVNDILPLVDDPYFACQGLGPAFGLPPSAAVTASSAASGAGGYHGGSGIDWESSGTPPKTGVI